MIARHRLSGLSLAAVLLVFAPACLAGHSVVQKLLGRGHACDGCGACTTCRVCKPVPDKKKVTKTVYECKEEWYCLPKCPCPMHRSKHTCCDDAGTSCTTCEKPRVRRILVKKLITVEEPTTKCVVETVPACDPHTAATATPAPATAARTAKTAKR